MAFNTLGVSFSFLLKIKNDPRYSEGMDTSAIKKAIVLPDTLERKCAYIDLYAGENDAKGRLYVSRATAFVSHAWQYTFDLPLDVMQTHSKSDPNAYFWYDVFINNQHVLADTDLGAAFQDSITEIGTVLLVMSPWNNPIPLTRAWCLWEIFCSIKGGGAVTGVPSY